MRAEGPRPPSDFELPAAGQRFSSLSLLPSLWGVAIIAGLLVYSINSAVEARPVVPQPERVVSAAVPSPTPASFGSSFTRSRTTVILSCDGEETSGTAYDGMIPVNYVVLAMEANRETVIEVLEGRSTTYRRNWRVIHTQCFQRALDGGAFP